MKKNILATAALAAFAATAATSAHAQSSVTLYGIIDAGISYVNNAARTGGSDSLVKYDDGVAQGSRWGLKGSEDLGGGLKAIFTLENGFNSGTGTLGQGGAEFGRQAYVGIAKNDVGSLTFGRQYSFSTDYLGGNYSIGGQTVAGNYAYHINDVDQLTSSRINNAVKFSSASFYGVTFGAMYGFSNQAGAFAGAPNTTVGTTTVAGSSRAYSFGLNYKAGPFGIGAAYTDIHYPGAATPAFSTNLANIATGGTKDLRTFGIGANYAFGAATVFGLWTNTRFEPITGASSKLNAFDIGGKYNFTSALTAGLGYTYMDLTDNFKGHWHQVDASVDYALSKRTDVYALAIYQKASGSNNGVENQAQIGSATSYFGSSGLGENNQLAFRVGIRHKF
ncbi:porin [Caballeronia insecticola]|uniref:Porin Gram-negative type n=1 Tax=Caballeronia insecticola TaxID=758793 RepID=R4WKD3_9BURK|nr:porin [Caballeronia insecticola]BAN25008.1 porin Gram-negative type [Caballeronia insecticola]